MDVIPIRCYLASTHLPRVTTKGHVTIAERIRDALGIEPGDEVAFEEVDSGYIIQEREPTTSDGDDPFEKYRAALRVLRRCRIRRPFGYGDRFRHRTAHI
nr:AbrB/MazE/SpoVT family DNA-binding domain-containing protein [Halobellus captivus]